MESTNGSKIFVKASGADADYKELYVGLPDGETDSFGNTTLGQAIGLVSTLFCVGVGLVVIFVYIQRRRSCKVKEKQNANSKGKDLAKPLESQKWHGELTSATNYDYDHSHSHIVLCKDDFNEDSSHREETKNQEFAKDHFLTCQICSQDFQEGDDVLESNNMSCRHFFHTNCIEKWLNYQYACPICSEQFVLQEVWRFF